jgi:hypothetical protein
MTQAAHSHKHTRHHTTNDHDRQLLLLVTAVTPTLLPVAIITQLPATAADNNTRCLQLRKHTRTLLPTSKS